MPCDTKLKPGQTIGQRKNEVQAAVDRYNAGLVSGAVTATVGPQGAVAFSGLSDADRDGVTDACAYRLLMLKGSPLAKAKLASAEARAGRSVSRNTLAAGIHSHDGGKTWHHGH